MKIVTRARGAALTLFVAGAVGSGCGSNEVPPEPVLAKTAITTTAVTITDGVTLTASQDTTVRVGTPNQNFGADTALDVNRALIAFDNAALRAAVGAQDVVASAQLELTLTDNRLRVLPRVVGAFRLTDAWTEAGATWNCPVDTKLSNSRPDCANPWSMGVLPPNPWVSPATSTITVPARQSGAVVFDVTADVRAYLNGTASNHGWMLRGSTPGEFAEFASRETATPPRLRLTVRRCSPTLCDDGNACTVDGCDAAAACVHTAVANGTACSDGNACTQADSCQAGACTGGSPVICAALDACHQTGMCDPSSGACSNPVQPAGAACAGTNLCDGAGACVQCLTAANCPGGDDVCGARTCTGGACGVAFAPAGTACGTGLACNGSGGCAGIPHVVINEVESSGGVPGDWVELYNAGTAAADVSGWRFLDNDNTHVAYVIPSGTNIAPGAYLVLEEAQFGFGLGTADSARLSDASGAAVETYSWTAHAATTYGRCPNGTGAFGTTTVITKGAANDCSVAVKINEIESSGGAPGDWVELINTGPTPADVSGWRLLDADDTHVAYVIPAGTSIAPGAYLVLEEAQFGFGLGSPDNVRLFDASGTILDTYAWTPHATTSYGRCPNGTGAFTTTGTVTKGAANDCGVVGPPPPPPASVWPGGNNVTTVDGTTVFGGNLSDLFYEPATASAPAVMWAVRNGPSTLYRLVWNGTIWTPETGAGWDAGKTLLYPSATGGPDSEGVTRAELDSPAIYIATERDNLISGVSRVSILRFDTSLPGAEMVATHEWNLNGDLPAVGPNLGLEAIAWVPDSYLAANGFFDEAAGHTYNPAEYSNHGTGLFFVGVEANGIIYAYALDHVSGGFRRIATIASGNPGVMGVTFDREVGYLWAYCDDTCGNVAGVMSVDTTAGSATLGKFKLLRQLARPSTMANINNEGIGIAPESECSSGFKGVYWADDSQTDGHSIRADSIPCGRFIP